jgi:hypothetical protein
MSHDPSGERVLVNWRGPLLAAGIFAAVFALLLLMAHQNESNTSDLGSSLRQDPYGTSLFFDSYGRAGYQVKRSQDEDSLSDQNASSTTAFFIGGDSDDWETEDGKLRTSETFLRRVEDFLARGGRVVLIEPAWGLTLKSPSEGWEVAKESSQSQTAPAWIAPNLRAMPPGSEMMYIAADTPWLKTDPQWTALYAGPVTAIDGTPAKTESAGVPSAHVYMAVRPVGKGELIAASQESFLLNETIKTHPNPVLLDFLAGGRPVIWVDESLHGLRQDQGVLWLVQRYRLQAALLLFWATLLALLWSMSGDLVRRPRGKQNTQTLGHSQSAGVAAQLLLQRSIAAEQLLTECWEQFCRRWPQDAQAIAADPRRGGRLRAALAQAPLPGYRALSEMIAEHRASAKGLIRTAPHATASSTALPKTLPEEARIA